MRFAFTFCNAFCNVTLVALFCSAMGCATTNKTIQSVAQKFNFSQETSGESLAPGAATKPDPRVTSLLDDAIASWSDGDMDETRKLLGQAIKRDPRNREARHLMANLLAAEEDYEGAQVQLRKALQDAPDDARTHHALASLLEQIGNTEEAAQHLERATQLDSSLQEMDRGIDVATANFSQKTVVSASSQPSSTESSAAVKTAFHLGDQ